MIEDARTPNLRVKPTPQLLAIVYRFSFPKNQAFGCAFAIHLFAGSVVPGRMWVASAGPVECKPDFTYEWQEVGEHTTDTFDQSNRFREAAMSLS